MDIGDAFSRPPAQEKLKNVIEVPFAGGSVARLISLGHGPVPPEALGEVDALAVSLLELDSGYDGDEQEWARVLQSVEAGEYKGSLQHARALIIAAREKNLPVFGVNTPLPPSAAKAEMQKLEQRSNVGAAFLALATAALYFSIYVNRREFFKIMGDSATILAAGGLYLNAPGIMSVVGKIPHNPTREVVDELTGKVLEWQGLADFTLKLRALAIAEKLHTVARGLATEDKQPKIALLAGVSITSMLKEALTMNPATRKKLLAGLVENLTDLDPLSASTFKSTLAAIPTARPAGGRWDAKQAPQRTEQNTNTDQKPVRSAAV